MRTFTAILIISVMTFAVFSRVLTCGFVNYDDDGYVYENRQVVSGLSASGVIYAFTTLDKGNWIPLTWLSHLLDVEVFGLNPAGHHLSNLFLHIINAILLYVFLRITTHREWPSLIVALLFAVHPLHIESVAWVSERKGLLSTFFFLSAMIAYSRYAIGGSVKLYLLTLILSALSLLAKPMLVTFPFILLLVDYWPLNRTKIFSLSLSSSINRKLIVEKIPFFLLSLAIGSVTLFAQDTAQALASPGQYPLSEKIAHAVTAYTLYLYKTVLPLNLAVIYPYSKNISLLWAFFSALIIIVITGYVFYKIKMPYLFTGWFWFLITLLPVIGLIQVGVQSMADRYTYVPLIGIFIGVTWGIVHAQKQHHINPHLIILLACVILISFSLKTWKQIEVWKNSISLFRHAVSVTHENWVAHLNLGEALFDRGDINKAMLHYQQAIKINPLFELAYLNLGTAYASKGEIDKAIESYKTALTIKKELPAAHLNLGNAYYRKGDYETAHSYYLYALKLKPDYPEAYNGLGAVMLATGDPRKAIAAFEQALRIDPKFHAAENNLKAARLK